MQGFLTCTNAVAMMTPVPKCLQKKNTGAGILRPEKFLANIGNPALAIEATSTMTATHLGYTFSSRVARLALGACELTQSQNMNASVIFSRSAAAPAYGSRNRIHLLIREVQNGQVWRKCGLRRIFQWGVRRSVELQLSGDDGRDFALGKRKPQLACGVPRAVAVTAPDDASW